MGSFMDLGKMKHTLAAEATAEQKDNDQDRYRHTYEPEKQERDTTGDALMFFKARRTEFHNNLCLG